MTELQEAGVSRIIEKAKVIADKEAKSMSDRQFIYNVASAGLEGEPLKLTDAEFAVAIRRLAEALNI